MNKADIAKLLNTAKKAALKHSPEILTGVGIAGMVTTTILAVRATPKALRLINEAEDAKDEPLTTIEVVKVAWKPYIPATVTGVASVICLVGASSVSMKRNAALATAYELSKTALAEYREKVVETVGEKQEKQIRDAVNKDRIEKQPVSKSEVIITEKGNTLCFDTISQRYFTSDIERINRAINTLNKQMLHDLGGCASVNDLYDELDMSHLSIGDDLGWDVNDGLIDVSFSSHIADDGRPCIVLDYSPAPKYDYY